MKQAALVTGGNRGIGLEVCRQLGQRNYQVLLGAREQAEGEAAAAALRGEGLEAEALVLDVTDPQSMADAASVLAARPLKLDALVNNAGIALQGFDQAVAERTCEVNFFGPLRLTMALRPHLARGGRVVMVSSGLAELSGLSPRRRRDFEPPPPPADIERLVRRFVDDVRAGRHAEQGWPGSAYRVSKIALNALARRWSQAMPEQRVNAVCPGWVRTRMGGPSAARSPEQGAVGVVWAATLPPHGPTGGFFRDGQPIGW